jgi:hypothetical protein
LGGKPGASTYIIGVQNDKAFYLDPHDVKPVCTIIHLFGSFFFIFYFIVVVESSFICKFRKQMIYNESLRCILVHIGLGLAN